jgi:hypothetical protein
MSITAARSELNVQLIGESNIAEMLAQSQRQLAAYENQVKSLKSAAEGQAKGSALMVRGIQDVNAKMSETAKSATSLVDGMDKIKGAVGKVVGAFGFFGAAAASVYAVVQELIPALGTTNKEIERLGKELEDSKKSGEDFSKTMRDMATSIAAVQVSTNTLAGTTAQLRMRLSQIRGDALGAEFERRNMEVLQALETQAKLETEMNQTRAGQTKAAEQIAEAQKQLNTGLAEEARLKEEIRKVEMDARLGIKSEDGEITHLKRLQLQEMVAQNREARNAIIIAKGQTAELERQFQQLAENRNLAQQLTQAIETQVLDPSIGQPSAAPARRSGGGGRRSQQPDSEAASMRAIEQIRLELYWMEQELELERDLADEEESRAMKAQLRAERAAEEAERLRIEMEAMERMDIAKPWLDFSAALSDHMGPALAQVSAAMQDVNKLFAQFAEGQIGFQQALEGSTHAIGRMVAEQIGGVRAAAAVDAAYHLYKGFGSMFTNPAESAGHFIAAAGLGAVAAGAIPSGTSAAKPAAARATEQRPQETATTTEGRSIVYNIQAGVMDGQSVSAAIRRSERASRGTGYTREMGV